MDRHGLRPRDDKVCEGMTVGGSVTHTLCHCEEGAERGTRQSIVSRGKAIGCLRFAYWSPVDRHGLRPRDDKTGKTEYYEWTLKKLKRICPKYFAF